MHMYMYFVDVYKVFFQRVDHINLNNKSRFSKRVQAKSVHRGMLNIEWHGTYASKLHTVLLVHKEIIKTCHPLTDEISTLILPKYEHPV